MPRKKSAAKKAREAEERSKNEQEELERPHKEQANVEQADVKEAETESSTSEQEDEYGELITEDVEEGINRVLTALRNGNTEQLLNPDVQFFQQPKEAAKLDNSVIRHRPIYLKDYHRMNILSGDALKEDGEDIVDDKQSYASLQNEERSQILKEINEEFDKKKGDNNHNSDYEDDLLVKKEEPTSVAELKLPNPVENGEQFLRTFDSNHAWIPHKGDNLGGNMEEDDEAFDTAAENFENAYNFRFEDPASASIISYARNQATLRRSDTSSRRRKRDEIKQRKEIEKREKEKNLHKKKTEKVHKLADLFEELQLEYGKQIDKGFVEKVTERLMNSDFQVDEWDRVISELFDSKLYSDEDRPEWDKNDEIMADFYKEKERETKDEEDIPSDLDGPPEKKARKEKNEKKKAKKQLHETVENAVENNRLALMDEVDEERKSRALTKEEQSTRFRYREVSPESFGLTVRDIFAADDSELNKYIGLKKFAPYRPKELKMKDKRKAAKPRRLKEWRKEVFHDQDGPLLAPPESEQRSILQRKSNKKRKEGK